MKEGVIMNEKKLVITFSNENVDLSKVLDCLCESICALLNQA